MMDRRLFLKLTGLVAAASAFEALPVAAAGAPRAEAAVTSARAVDPAASAPSVQRLAIREPGTYQISGLVRLEEPVVDISGITNSQRISRSEVEGAELPVAAFTTFEYFDRPGLTPPISVRGGALETLAVVPIDLE
jgi:hypothetical protein